MRRAALAAQREPWLERDKAMIDKLKSIGIEKSTPFSPDARTQEILNQAGREAAAWLDIRYEGVFSLKKSPQRSCGIRTLQSNPGIKRALSERPDL
jgi:hypothetical protein